MAVADGDVVLVPRGHHPCGAPYGFEMYYLNVMAGPLPQVALRPRPRGRVDHEARRLSTRRAERTPCLRVAAAPSSPSAAIRSHPP